MKTLLSFLILYIFLISSSNKTFAQDVSNKIDSLELVVKKNNSFDNNHSLADLYSDSDLVKAEKYARKAVKIANANKDVKQQGLSYNTLGNILQYQSKLDSSLIYTKKSLIYRLKDKDSIGIADSYNNIGIVYDQKSEYALALENYFKALKIYENKRQFDKEAMVASNIGVVYKAQKEYKKSLDYYLLAYRLYKKLHHDFGKTVTSGNIASTLIYFKKYNEALAYNKQAEDGYKRLKLDRYLGYPISTSAVIYDSLKNRNKATANYLLAIQLHKEHNNGHELADNSKNFSDFLFRQAEYIESIKYAHEAVALASENDLPLIENEAYNVLAKNYAALGDFKRAYDYQQLYVRGKNKIFESDKTKTVFELEKKYQTAKKDNELLENRNKIFRRNISIYTLIGLFLLLLIAGFVWLKGRKKSERIKMQEVILKQEQMAAKAVIETEDRERKRMATHLHDGIGQSLAVLNMNMSVLNDYRDDDQKFYTILSRTQNLLDDAITDVRSLSHTIMPNMLIKHKLSDALRELIEKSNTPKLNISLEMEGLEDTIESNIQVVIYRIIQECIQNTIKHAQAEKVSIQLKQSQSEIFVTIKDDGIGFDPLKNNAKNESVGLENIKSRIDYLKGVIEVNSKPGAGTEIKVYLPLS